MLLGSRADSRQETRTWQGVCQRLVLAAMCTVGLALPALAAGGTAPEPLYLAGIPVDFILFALTLLGVAVFHNQTFYVALAGLAAVIAYKLGFTGFKTGQRRCEEHARRVALHYVRQRG